MASALMARVWIVFILAQHNNAESHRGARGRSTDQDEFHGGSVRKFRSVTDDQKDRRTPALVENFLTDFFTNKGGAIKQWKTSSAFMDISKLPDRDSGHELAYVDATGRLCPKSAACYPTLSKNVLRHHVRRAPQDEFLDLWSIDEIPDGPFDPDTTAAPPQAAPQPVDPFAEVIDADFNQFWGIEAIPIGPFDPAVTFPPQPFPPQTFPPQPFPPQPFPPQTFPPQPFPPQPFPPQPFPPQPFPPQTFPPQPFPPQPFPPQPFPPQPFPPQPFPPQPFPPQPFPPQPFPPQPLPPIDDFGFGEFWGLEEIPIGPFDPDVTAPPQPFPPQPFPPQPFPPQTLPPQPFPPQPFPPQTLPPQPFPPQPLPPIDDFGFGEFWGLEEIPIGPFDPDVTAPPQPFPPQPFPPQPFPPQTLPPQPFPPQPLPPIDGIDFGFNEFWGLEEIPIGPFDPHVTAPPQTFPPQTFPPQTFPPQTFPPQTFPPQTLPPQTLPPQTLPPQTLPPQTLPPIDIDFGFNEFWGLEEIPDEPYTGVDIVIPALTTTAPVTTTTPNAASA